VTEGGVGGDDAAVVPGSPDLLGNLESEIRGMEEGGGGSVG